MVTNLYPSISKHDLNGRRIWWNTVLTLDEKSRLDQLMGAALLDPGTAERLLNHDVALINGFQFSPVLREWLLQTEATTIQEFAQSILDKLKEQVRLITISSRPSIVITSEEVRRAAQITLIGLKRGIDHPLQELALVDEYLTNPHLPTSPVTRQIALQNLLAQIITNEFQRHCMIFNMPLPEPTDSMGDAHQHIRLIAHNRSPRLAGWGWLYYHYVCIDLDISADAFARMLNVDKRTLRRYQQLAFHSLAEQLIILESQARLRLHTASLETQPEAVCLLF